MHISYLKTTTKKKPIHLFFFYSYSFLFLLHNRLKTYRASKSLKRSEIHSYLIWDVLIINKERSQTCWLYFEFVYWRWKKKKRKRKLRVVEHCTYSSRVAETPLLCIQAWRERDISKCSFLLNHQAGEHFANKNRKKKKPSHVPCLFSAWWVIFHIYGYQRYSFITDS